MSGRRITYGSSDVSSQRDTRSVGGRRGVVVFGLWGNQNGDQEAKRAGSQERRAKAEWLGCEAVSVLRVRQTGEDVRGDGVASSHRVPEAVFQTCETGQG